jgi:hypothetical protein
VTANRTLSNVLQQHVFSTSVFRVEDYIAVAMGFGTSVCSRSLFPFSPSQRHCFSRPRLDSAKEAAAADGHGWTARRASCLAAAESGDGRGLGAALLVAWNRFSLSSEAFPGHTSGSVKTGTADPRVLQGEGASVAGPGSSGHGCWAWSGGRHVVWDELGTVRIELLVRLYK